MEITTQVIKDVTAMNVHAGVHEFVKLLHSEVKHIGNHLSERMKHLDDQREHSVISEEEEAEYERLDHLLGSAISTMDTIAALAEANDVGYKMVTPKVSESPEELETIRDVVINTPEYKSLLAIMEGRKNAGKTPGAASVEALIEMLKGNLWNDKEALNGN